MGDSVMEEGAVCRGGLYILDPSVFCEPCGQNDVLVLENAALRDRERLGQLECDIWFGNGPSLDELPGRRKILRIAFRGTRVRPGADGIDLSLRQRPIVRKLLGMPILEP